MERIMVTGCPGSGKSCFSRALRDKIGLPLYPLDMIWHKPDKTTVSREEFDARLGQLLLLDKWIIDGNYSRTMEKRLECCDTVFLFDLPTRECIAGVEARIGKKREDMPWIEMEFDPEFREFIENFATHHLPYIYELLEKYRDKVNITVFRSRREADEFLNNIRIE